VKSILEADPSQLDGVNDENQTMLHVAVGAQQVEVVKYLLRNSVEVNSQDYEGNTPLHTAAACGRIDMVHLLERARGDPTVRTFFGETLFHICTKAVSSECVFAI
jgi:acyl-CoA-binding domain-containing protein 6